MGRLADGVESEGENNMLTKLTLENIWHCYREIEAGEKLLTDLAETRKQEEERSSLGHEPQLKDVFGRRRDLQLGVPSGESGHRLFAVAPRLAESIIRAHIGNKQADLIRLHEQARLELETLDPAANAQIIVR